jgi:hypothetical protein
MYTQGLGVYIPENPIPSASLVFLFPEGLYYKSIAIRSHMFMCAVICSTALSPCLFRFILPVNIQLRVFKSTSCDFSSCVVDMYSCP